MLIAIEAEDRQSKPATNSRSFHPEGEKHEDASCCRHSCDGDRSPRSGEGEAGEIGAPARLSVVGATRLLPRLPSAGLVPRLVIELLIFGVDGWQAVWVRSSSLSHPKDGRQRRATRRTQR